MLAGVTTRLADVQARLVALVPAETLLVTHSGENDLQALKVGVPLGLLLSLRSGRRPAAGSREGGHNRTDVAIMVCGLVCNSGTARPLFDPDSPCPPPLSPAQLIHANVLDTSVMFPHPRGPPYKSALRILASRHLTRTIQRGRQQGLQWGWGRRGRYASACLLLLLGCRCAMRMPLWPHGTSASLVLSIGAWLLLTCVIPCTTCAPCWTWPCPVFKSTFLNVM